MPKMSTIKHLAVGSAPLKNSDEARIERNLFALNGDTFEALRFCKQRNGRHNRVHLVLSEAEFLDLFAHSVRAGVFSRTALLDFAEILRREALADTGPSDALPDDPFLKVIGIGSGDGTLTQNLDEELYGDDPA